MGRRADRSRLTRTPRFQAIPVGKRVRGGCYERALLRCRRARSAQEPMNGPSGPATLSDSYLSIPQDHVTSPSHRR